MRTVIIVVEYRSSYHANDRYTVIYLSWCRWLTVAWWRHQMETFSALLVICAGNHRSPVNSPPQRPVTRSFDVFFDRRLNKRLNKQWWGWWFETLSRPLWRHRNGHSASLFQQSTQTATAGFRYKAVHYNTILHIVWHRKNICLILK